MEKRVYPLASALGRLDKYLFGLLLLYWSGCWRGVDEAPLRSLHQARPLRFRAVDIGALVAVRRATGQRGG